MAEWVEVLDQGCLWFPSKNQRRPSFIRPSVHSAIYPSSFPSLTQNSLANVHPCGSIINELWVWAQLLQRAPNNHKRWVFESISHQTVQYHATEMDEIPFTDFDLITLKIKNTPMTKITHTVVLLWSKTYFSFCSLKIQFWRAFFRVFCLILEIQISFISSVHSYPHQDCAL